MCQNASLAYRRHSSTHIQRGLCHLIRRVELTHLRAGRAMSRSTQQNPLHLVSAARYSQVARTNLGCSANMWVLHKPESVSSHSVSINHSSPRHCMRAKDTRLILYLPLTSCRVQTGRVSRCLQKPAKYSCSTSRRARSRQHTVHTRWQSGLSRGRRIQMYVWIHVSGFLTHRPCQLLISASEDKRLILHDVRVSSSGKSGSGAVATLTGHSSWVLSTDISLDGRLALSGSADKTAKVWDIGARAAVSTVQDQGEVWSVSWRPKPPAHGTAGAYVSGGEDGLVRWWRSAGAG